MSVKPHLPETPRRITTEEVRAIASLKSIARTWPPTLGLFSANGTLLVVKLINGEFPDPGVQGAIEKATVGTIAGIVNDGGDPD